MLGGIRRIQLLCTTCAFEAKFVELLSKGEFLLCKVDGFPASGTVLGFSSDGREHARRHAGPRVDVTRGGIAVPRARSTWRTRSTWGVWGTLRVWALAIVVSIPGAMAVNGSANRFLVQRGQPFKISTSKGPFIQRGQSFEMSTTKGLFVHVSHSDIQLPSCDIVIFTEPPRSDARR